MPNDPLTEAPRSLRWERQIVCWLARLHARADGAASPSLDHFRRARQSLRHQQRLNAEAATAVQEAINDDHR